MQTTSYTSVYACACSRCWQKACYSLLAGSLSLLATGVWPFCPSHITEHCRVLVVAQSHGTQQSIQQDVVAFNLKYLKHCRCCHTFGMGVSNLATLDDTWQVSCTNQPFCLPCLGPSSVAGPYQIAVQPLTAHGVPCGRAAAAGTRNGERTTQERWVCGGSSRHNTLHTDGKTSCLSCNSLLDCLQLCGTATTTNLVAEFYKQHRYGVHAACYLTVTDSLPQRQGICVS